MKRTKGQQRHARRASIESKAAQEYQRQQKEFHEKLDKIPNKDGNNGGK